MKTTYRPTGLGCLLVLGTSFAAQGQATTNTASQPSAVAAALHGRYTAAHDSLMRRVADVRAEAEARMSYFKTTTGSLGGLHREVKSYAGVATFLVKRQVVRQCYGTELEKLDYYDVYGRKVLAERYEGRQLTRLELLEYPATPGKFRVGRWLLVRGDYLQHDVVSATAAISPTGERKPAAQQTSYFFHAQPISER